MTLRRKTLLLVTLTLGGLIAVLFGVVSHIWLGSFADLEYRQAATDVARLREALRAELGALERTTSDWAMWDDTYAFVEDGNRAFAQSNLRPPSLQGLAVSAIAFVREPGRTTFACSVHPDDDALGPFPSEVADWIERGETPATTGRPTSGVLRAGDGFVLVAACPILTSARTGPQRGALVLCRALDAPAVASLAERTRLDVALHPWGPATPPDVAAAVAQDPDGAADVVAPLDAATIAGYARVADLYGRPALVLSMKTPRGLHAEGRRGLALLLAALLVAGCVFGVLTILLLERQVLSRLNRLRDEVQRVGRTGDLSLRTTPGGRDELEETAIAINGMLDALEQAHRRRVESEAALRVSEDALRHTYKLEAIGQLAGGVAHDFNNLLTVVSGYTELLLHRDDLDASARSNLEAMRRAADRAADLTQKLLAFGRRQPVQPRVLRLDRFVEENGDMVRRMVGDQIEVVVEVAPPVEPVRIDPSQLTQLLLNLASNARDAMPDGGRLTFAVATVAVGGEVPGVPPGRWVRLTVSDDGVGMDAATASRIFEPFFTTKGVGRGSGLGLASVHGIVHQAEGRITVTTAPGRGTRFGIHLPPCREPTGEITAEIAPAPRASGIEAVLLVEDMAAVREVARAALASCGYAVVTAATPHEALDLAETTPFDCLVTDVLMPRLRGPDLARRVQAIQPGIKVLFISGFPDDAGGHASLEPGAAFLAKPFRCEDLTGAVRRLLDTAHEPAPASA